MKEIGYYYLTLLKVLFNKIQTFLKLQESRESKRGDLKKIKVWKGRLKKGLSFLSSLTCGRKSRSWNDRAPFRVLLQTPHFNYQENQSCHWRLQRGWPRLSQKTKLNFFRKFSKTRKKWLATELTKYSLVYPSSLHQLGNKHMKTGCYYTLARRALSWIAYTSPFVCHLRFKDGGGLWGKYIFWCTKYSERLPNTAFSYEVSDCFSNYS